MTMGWISFQLGQMTEENGQTLPPDHQFNALFKSNILCITASLPLVLSLTYTWPHLLLPKRQNNSHHLDYVLYNWQIFGKLRIINQKNIYFLNFFQNQHKNAPSIIAAASLMTRTVRWEIILHTTQWGDTAVFVYASLAWLSLDKGKKDKNATEQK